jgi:hypothetical protein
VSSKVCFDNFSSYLMKCVYTFLWLSFPCLEIQSVYTKLLSADRAKYRKAVFRGVRLTRTRRGTTLLQSLQRDNRMAIISIEECFTDQRHLPKPSSDLGLFRYMDIFLY